MRLAHPYAVRPRHALVWIVIGWSMALGALVYAPLVKAAQARAWCVARTMVETGDFAVPRYNGEVRLKKPPLASWVQAGAMEAIGSTDRRVAGFASWFVGLLFALGPFLLGVALRRPYAGFLGSVLLVTSRSAAIFGASPEHDVPFAGTIAVSLAFLARATGVGGRWRTALLAGLACGAAVLVKGPFALAFVLGTALVVGGARRARPGELSRTTLWAALIGGSLLPAALWLGVLFARLGGVSPVFDEMRRQALGEAGAHLKSGLANALYYVGMIPKWSMPWTVVLVPMIAMTLWRRRRGERAPSALPSFAIRSFLVTVLVLTVVPAKQEHYLLPALPAAFLIGAVALENAMRQRIRLARAIPVALAALAVAFAVERAGPAIRAGMWSSVPWWRIAALLGVGALPVLAGGRRARLRLLFVPIAMFAAFTASSGDAFRNRETDDVEISTQKLSDRVRADRPVIGYAAGVGEAFDTTAAYLHRVVTRVATIEALAARMDEAVGATVLVERPEDPALEPLRRRLERVGEISPVRPAEKDRILVYRVAR